MAKMPKIDDLPHFTEHLGKARTDRIRYAQIGRVSVQTRALNIENDLQQRMLDLEYTGKWNRIDDILAGGANSVSDNTLPISKERLRNIFVTLPIINTRQIQVLMNLGERQSRRYMAAVKLVLPFLRRALEKTE